MKKQRWVRRVVVSLNSLGRNRLLISEPEMIGRTVQVCAVVGPVGRMIHQETGRMAPRESTVTLEGEARQGRRTGDRRPANPTVWCEAWLERVAPDAIDGGRA